VIIERVRAYACRHDLWRRGTGVISALSGGADSVALLLLLRDLHLAGDLVLDCAAHLNHGIRGAESDGDQEFCRVLCDGLGVSFVTTRVDVPASARHHRVSIEVAARRARHAFLSQVRESRGADVVATAHTEDDQAETVLLRIVRGAGGRGLAGVRPRRRHLIRPLLSTTRDELRRELAARRQEWREDTTNADLANPRNRVRHELLPYLQQHFNRSVAQSLARLADVARADETWIDALVDEQSRGIVRSDGGLVSLNVSGFLALPEGLARRVVRRALELAHSGSTARLRDADLVIAVAAGRRAAAEFSGLRVERFRDSAVLIKRARESRPRQRGTKARV
jgi:tRNA(Ile)-lysidine synthase